MVYTGIEGLSSKKITMSKVTMDSLSYCIRVRHGGHQHAPEPAIAEDFVSFSSLLVDQLVADFNKLKIRTITFHEYIKVMPSGKRKIYT